MAEPKLFYLYPRYSSPPCPFPDIYYPYDKFEDSPMSPKGAIFLTATPTEKDTPVGIIARMQDPHVICELLYGRVVPAHYAWKAEGDRDVIPWFMKPLDANISDLLPDGLLRIELFRGSVQHKTVRLQGRGSDRLRQT